ncbi:hypothetical protein Poly59_19980 [Rubripirellula reticaptiva]|uniref:Uncharacterized protein n=1 Tax=Rubripirellula reticaptiva TaxID=2528013 RepID=A0A5C6F308_9BACT|nr:hypothetical protein Poly59_19980 [Rubripirellula reticaptiva]
MAHWSFLSRCDNYRDSAFAGLQLCVHFQSWGRMRPRAIKLGNHHDHSTNDYDYRFGDLQRLHFGGRRVDSPRTTDRIVLRKRPDYERY